MSDTKVNLKKIIGLEEEINKLAKQPDRDRVLGDKGVHWLNGYGENGKEPTEDEKEEAAKKDPGKGGAKNLDDTKDASEPLKIGDDAGDMGELKDCSSGRCVNVRLHGQAPPPNGWSGVCTPPSDTTYVPGTYVYGGLLKKINGITTNATANYKSTKEFAQVIKSFMRVDAVNDNGEKAIQKAIDYLEAGRVNFVVSAFFWYPGGPTDGVYYVISPAIYSCSDGRAPELCDKKPPSEPWPKDTCSEVIAGAAGFKGACAAHDPNLPPQFAETKGEITLCDKDGNEVKFTKTDEGYEVYQAKYRRTAVVDPNTFKVVKFK